MFFASGTSALLFETVWFRLAGLTFGNSVWASSMVLAAFMAGLAIGNALAATSSRRSMDPLRLYAALEMTVGISGLLLVFALVRLSELLAPLFRPLIDSPALLNATRLGSAAALMIQRDRSGLPLQDRPETRPRSRHRSQTPMRSGSTD